MQLADPMVIYQSRFSEEPLSEGERTPPSSRTTYNSFIGEGHIEIYDTSGEWVDFLRYDFQRSYSFSTEGESEGKIILPFSFAPYEFVPSFRLYAESIKGGLTYLTESKTGTFTLPSLLTIVSLRFQIKNQYNAKRSLGGLTSNLKLNSSGFSLRRHERTNTLLTL